MADAEAFASLAVMNHKPVAGDDWMDWPPAEGTA
jgi:hypothetical protein